MVGIYRLNLSSDQIARQSPQVLLEQYRVSQITPEVAQQQGYRVVGTFKYSTEPLLNPATGSGYRSAILAQRQEGRSVAAHIEGGKITIFSKKR